MKSAKSKKAPWKPDVELPMLDAILAGQKLWDSKEPVPGQRIMLTRAARAIREEHQYMLDNEPEDQFHVCVLLGALNVIEGALSKKKVLE